MIKRAVFFFLAMITNVIFFAASANANQCIANMNSHIINSDTLWLDDCHLTDKEIPQIIAYLEHHSKITQLYLLNNSIGDAGAMLLAKNKTLKMLELRNNLITVKGARALAHSSIHMLDLQGNKFNAAHLAALNKHAGSHVLPQQAEAIILA